MAKRTLDNIKLGIFVLAGLTLLIVFLYLLGKNQSIFASRFEVKAHFKNVSGLVAGNNVRVSGIVVGIVEEVKLVNDTLVVVTLALNDEMRNVIRKNALASIGTDGLIGNRVVNLLPAKEPAPLIEPGDILRSQKDVDTEEMLRTLDLTNRNILSISEGLKQTIERINQSAQLSTILNDESLSRDLKAALSNLRNATGTASETMRDLHLAVGDVREGKGTVGYLLKDTSLAYQLTQVVGKLQSVENQADQLAKDMNQLVLGLQNDIDRGQGPANMILKDSLAAARIQNTLGNLEEGTARFNENMEALKHNFFFRRYFKKLEKQKKKGQ
ncbi:MAG: MCE family protein [Lewinellaceae bacterium]|nr:MCE family protein [Lewinellaceae bacterium]